jgi:hypothetical protein
MGARSNINVYDRLSRPKPKPASSLKDDIHRTSLDTIEEYVRAPGVSGENSGAKLYKRGQELKKRKDLFIESMREQLEDEQKVNLTFKPEINNVPRYLKNRPK